MPATITIPDPLTKRLQRRAQQQVVALDALVEMLLEQALSLPKQNGSHADDYDDEAVASLDQIVAQIQALPPNPAVIYEGARMHDMDYIAELLATPPHDTLPAAEWERLWPPLEQRLKEPNLASDVTEKPRRRP